MLMISRVDPKETSDEKRTPLQLAADRIQNSYSRNLMEIEKILREAIEGEELPDDAKIKQLSKLMYLDDQEEAKTKFRELLASLSPELVSSQLIKSSFTLWLNYEVFFYPLVK